MSEKRTEEEQRHDHEGIQLYFYYNVEKGGLGRPTSSEQNEFRKLKANYEKKWGVEW